MRPCSHTQGRHAAGHGHSCTDRGQRALCPRPRPHACLGPGAVPGPNKRERPRRMQLFVLPAEERYKRGKGRLLQRLIHHETVSWHRDRTVTIDSRYNSN